VIPVRGIVLLAIFIPSLPICFFNPFYGIVVWTIIAFLNPQWYTWWAAYIVPWALATAIPTLAGFVVFNRGWGRMVSRESCLVLILWIWFTITTMISTHNPVFAGHAEDTWARWQFVSKILLMTIVTMAIVDSFSRLRKLVIVIACCFGFFVAKSLPFMIATGGAYRIYGPEKSMIADNNDFGLALNMTVPIFFFLAQSESKPWVKRIFWSLFFMAIPTILFTYSRGALVGLLAVLALLLLRSKQRAFFIPALALGLFIATVFAPQNWKDRMDLTSGNVVDRSAESRFNAWTYSWRLAMDYPIAGGGFDDFWKELFDRYAPNPQDIHGPHSIYFGVLAEHGFVGLALYLIVVFSCFGTCIRILKLARIYEDPVAANYANMFLLSLVGFLTSGTFLGRAYFDYYFTILACISILKRVCFETWSQQTPEDLAQCESLSPAAEAV
jgi:probable O-glycosylation ligase (exosortase A-associated)